MASLLLLLLLLLPPPPPPPHQQQQPHLKSATRIAMTSSRADLQPPEKPALSMASSRHSCET
jgi:hypothetical protein